MARSADKRWISARRAAADHMAEAAELVRRRPDAVTDAARERLAQLLELLGGEGLEVTTTKTWDLASGLARDLLEVERAAPAPGKPLPPGYARPERA